MKILAAIVQLGVDLLLKRLEAPAVAKADDSVPNYVELAVPRARVAGAVHRQGSRIVMPSVPLFAVQEQIESGSVAFNVRPVIALEHVELLFFKKSYWGTREDEPDINTAAMWPGSPMMYHFALDEIIRDGWSITDQGVCLTPFILDSDGFPLRVTDAQVCVESDIDCVKDRMRSDFLKRAKRREQRGAAHQARAREAAALGVLGPIRGLNDQPKPTAPKGA